jgi:hypothetical protein
VSFSNPVSIPHFAYPLVINSAFGVQTVEQGSVQEIQSNVLMIVSCPVNTCPELPDFGIPDPTFQQAPPSAAGIIAAVQQIEPRAETSIVVSALANPGGWQMSVTAAVGGSGQ